MEFTRALDGVDLEAAPGEAVGLIGENGSGKTTLLRVVAGVSQVDAGEVRVAQPAAGILELGLGFHTDLTARENLYLYGASLGLAAAEVQRRLPEVLAFAELEEYADRPLYSFSSGMAARLAFAAATAVDPAVLVVDEALAVGDGAFQRKCIDRMVGFKERGKTVLFCSHAMYQVAEFCTRAVWLRQGRVEADGPAHEVINAYESYLRQPRQERAAAASRDVPEVRPAWLVELAVEPPPPHLPGQTLRVRAVMERAQPEEEVHVGVAFEGGGGVNLAVVATAWDGLPPRRGGRREEVVLEVPSFPAAAGRWDVTVYLADQRGLRVFDRRTLPGAVQVKAGGWTPGMVVLPHVWR